MKENMKKIAKTMRLSIFEVFEKMFFIFLESSGINNNEYDIEAAIQFRGTMDGEVKLLFSSDMINAMVQNMLNVKEDEYDAREMEDCAKEAVNIICGNFLGKLDSSEVFNLSIPTFNPGCSEISPGENSFRMDFDSDNGKIGVIIDVT
ncbi:MAG: chemotaxis protein CheX [Thermodesulfobacteriota bacterium]|nr:chemotaxis protein CheX [Thermodesulfobacteriota bacterium]